MFFNKLNKFETILLIINIFILVIGLIYVKHLLFITMLINIYLIIANYKKSIRIYEKYSTKYKNIILAEHILYFLMITLILLQNFIVNSTIIVMETKNYSYEKYITTQKILNFFSFSHILLIILWCIIYYLKYKENNKLKEK